MNWRRRPLALVLCTLLISVGLNSFCQTAANSPIKVLSAKRAERYTSSGPYGQELIASRPKEDVVLVLEIGGISIEEFQKIDAKKLYLMAGERRCIFNVASSGTINGKPQIKLAAIVPRQGLEFKLFAGEYPSKSFKAEDKIYDQLD
jgi:hypothetical protein